MSYQVVLIIMSILCITGKLCKRKHKSLNINTQYKKETCNRLLPTTHKLNFLSYHLIHSSRKDVITDPIPWNPILNYPLQSLNSFNVPAFADYYIQFRTLREIEDFCVKVDLTRSHFYILGGGSNTLFVKDFPGYILHIKLQGIEVIKTTNDKVLVKAAAGVKWHDLVLFCLKKGYGGIENLSLIPGTVGAAPVQNIGAYGVEIKDVVDTIETIDL